MPGDRPEGSWDLLNGLDFGGLKRNGERLAPSAMGKDGSQLESIRIGPLRQKFAINVRGPGTENEKRRACY